MESWGCIATGRGEGREGRGVFVCVCGFSERTSLPLWRGEMYRTLAVGVKKISGDAHQKSR